MAGARILLKTTIPTVEDDWHIGRFTILRDHLTDCGHTVFCQDRRTAGEGDIDLANLLDNQIDQVWLFAVDTVGALSDQDAEAIHAFRAKGGGLLLTRDHEDMGASLLKLGGVGRAHHFNSANCEPDPARRVRDDQATSYISWPNYHSGANGDYQVIETPAIEHPLVSRPDGWPIEFLPAHPHEGVVSVPPDHAGAATEIIRGRSKITGNQFGIAVAFSGEALAGGSPLGRAVAQSTFHHFVDPNLDPDEPLPSFCAEKPGTSMNDNPAALRDSLRYIENLAGWLS